MSKKLLLRLTVLVAAMMCALGATAANPYVIYTSSDSTLTFYCDNQVWSHPEGLLGQLNTGDNYPDWLNDNFQLGVAHVVFDPSFANARQRTMFAWFKDMTNLRTIEGWENLNTSHVTNMRGLFYGCSKLTSVDLSHFNTEVVTDMGYMFYGCSKLTSVDLGHFNTEIVTDMGYMFYGCSGLTSLDLSHFNTEVVTEMGYMFYGCSGITSLDLNNFDTSSVTDMESMFSGCSGLTSLDLSGFNTTKVTNMAGQFYNCSNLITVYVSSAWSVSKVTHSTNMFRYCSRIVGGMGTTYDSNNVDKFYAHIDGGTDNPGYFTEKAGAVITVGNPYVIYTSSDSTLTFYYDNQVWSHPDGLVGELNTGDNYPNWLNDNFQLGVAHVVFDPSFANARQRTMFAWFKDMTNLRTIEGWENLNTSHVTNMRGLFYGCSKLTSVDLSHFNTEVVTDMGYMFYGCNGLTSLDLSSFITFRVSYMYAMFEGCSGLTSLDLSIFDTSRVLEMYEMFKGCRNLTTIYVGNDWSTDYVNSSSNMFYNCTSLVGGMGTTYNASYVDKAYAHIDGGTDNPGYLSERLPEAYACYTPENTTLTFYYDKQRSTREGTTYDLNTDSDDPIWYTDGTNPSVTQVAFDASFTDARPTSTKDWFRDMSEIQSISGLEYLNTENVTNMNGMFYGCSGMTSLDLSHFNTAKVKDMGGLFRDCSGLKSVNLSGFITASVTYMNQMFYGCSDLTSLDLSSFNTRVLVATNGMFMNCNNLITIYASDEWSTQYTVIHSGMFTGCTSLVGGMGTTYDANHVDKTYAHIDGGPSNPGYFTDPNAPSVPEAYACFTPSDSTLTFYFDSGRRFRPGTSYDLNTGSNLPDWCNNGINMAVAQVVFDPSFADARPETTAGWFYHMYYLKSITGMAEYLNTVDVTDMGGMFYESSSLPSVDLSGFNTSKVENMTNMFRNCHDLITLDLTSFNTSQVTSMDGMFCNCVYLTTIYVGDGWSTEAVASSIDMFYFCLALEGGKGTAYDIYHSHTDAAYAHIDGGPSNPGYFTDPNAPEAYACYTSGNTTLTFYCDNQRNEREGTTYDLNKDYDEPGWLTDGNYSSVTQVVFDPSFADAYPRTTFLWFEDMVNLQSIEGMEYLNTSNVINMVEMFYNCSALTSLDVSGFNTANVTEMTWMFGNCHQLTSLDVSGFDTHNVTDMSAMFAECHGLTGLDLSGFNTDNVKFISEMFNGCRSLTSLDLSSFNTDNVNYMTGMFTGCSSLTTIFVGDEWSTNAVTSSDNMFTGCASLVGGKGTSYDANHVDGEYAHIDGGPSNPGYFTAKDDFLRGDVNGDGQVKINDVTALIDYLLSSDATGINVTAADCNQDGYVKINDVTALIDYLLGGSW